MLSFCTHINKTTFITTIPISSFLSRCKTGFTGTLVRIRDLLHQGKMADDFATGTVVVHLGLSLSLHVVGCREYTSTATYREG